MMHICNTYLASFELLHCTVWSLTLVAASNLHGSRAHGLLVRNITRFRHNNRILYDISEAFGRDGYYIIRLPHYLPVEANLLNHDCKDPKVAPNTISQLSSSFVHSFACCRSVVRVAGAMQPRHGYAVVAATCWP